MVTAVLSGKGGAGKTFVTVNLACTAESAVYIDCDVEEPNGRIFLKPREVREEPVCTMLPVFDRDRCDGCRRCVDFCRFNALALLKKKPFLFTDVCHSCGGCMLVCPNGAVREEPHRLGTVAAGKHRQVLTVTGEMNIGEASGTKIIEQAVRTGCAMAENRPVFIDCPPGSACTVMESIARADYCVLTAEPTAFGFHNFKMVYELVTLLEKPCGAVINKAGTPYAPLHDFCRANGIPVLLEIPYSEKIAALCADGRIAVEEDAETAALFRTLLQKIGGGIQS